MQERRIDLEGLPQNQRYLLVDELATPAKLRETVVRHLIDKGYESSELGFIKVYSDQPVFIDVFETDHTPKRTFLNLHGVENIVREAIEDIDVDSIQREWTYPMGGM